MYKYPLAVLVNLISGQTLHRIMQNRALASVQLHGNVLDVAGGSGIASYRSIIESNAKNKISAMNWVTCDINSNSNAQYVFDANSPWPMQDGIFDNALLMNSLYLYENPLFVLREMVRVLVGGGSAVISAPFLWHYCPEPVDLHRFTKEGVIRLVKLTGLRILHVECYGGRLTVSVDLWLPVLKKIYLYVPIAWICFLIEAIISNYFNSKNDIFFGCIVIGQKT